MVYPPSAYSLVCQVDACQASVDGTFASTPQSARNLGNLLVDEANPNTPVYQVGVAPRGVVATNATSNEGEAVKQLWEIVQAHLDKYGVREAAFAKKLGMSPQTLNSWKNRGVKALPARRHLEALARETGTPYSVVLDAALRQIAYLSEEAGEEHAQRRSAPMKPATIVWPDPIHYDDPTGYYAVWDRVAAGAIGRRATEYVQLIVKGVDPDVDVEPEAVTDMLMAALSAGMARAILEGVEEASLATLAALESGPASGPLRDAFGLAAHRGSPAHGKDTVTGEHSQDPDDYQP